MKQTEALDPIIPRIGVTLQGLYKHREFHALFLVVKTSNNLKCLSTRRNKNCEIAIQEDSA